jgi:hippurate hydrolase
MSMPPLTAGEDFAFRVEVRPSAFVFLGNGKAADGTVHNLHTARFAVNDQAIPTRVAYWISLVEQQLR